MRYRSTRNHPDHHPFSEALALGLAPDGGLFVPEFFPKVPADSFTGTETLAAIAERCLAPFLAGDTLERDLSAICRSTFTFPIPLRHLGEGTGLLELFHGPTAAFKDVGARFLAECVTRLPARGKRRLVLVATSGDTGGAVAAAFHRKSGIDVAILFPKGKISPRQEKQLTAWGDNVRAFAVRGTFDDCQRLVKTALADRALRDRNLLVSANSINVGRLLPQQIYYATASLAYRREKGKVPSFIIPTGNLGNAVAALYAKRLGFPIKRVCLATNANRAIPDYFSSGKWQPQPTIPTLANAMDVGNPSNMERVFHLYPEGKGMRDELLALSVTDAEISQTIREGKRKWGEVWCPHTATAVFAREKLGNGDWVMVATAHPAKFDTIVEPLVGGRVEVPEALREILARPSEVTEIGAEESALAGVVG